MKFLIKNSTPEDDRSILIETLSCNLQFFSELITTQLRISHGVIANSLYLSSSPCKATSLTSICIDSGLETRSCRARLLFRIKEYQSFNGNILLKGTNAKTRAIEVVASVSSRKFQACRLIKTNFNILPVLIYH